MNNNDSTNQIPTEDERIAYQQGYRDCCHDNGILYMGIEKSRIYNQVIAFRIEITDKEAEYLFPGHEDELAQHITQKLKEGYKKFKREGSLG